MKKIGEYTCKGTITAADVGLGAKRIILFDGKFTTGYRITEFSIAPADVDNTTAALFVCKAITDTRTSVPKEWNWDDNTEVAWGMCGFDANGATTPNAESWVDEDNLIIEDLYLHATENTDLAMNYMIKLDKYEFSDWRGALAMVRNRSQGLVE